MALVPIDGGVAVSRVSLIVAHDEGGVIAVDGHIPWDLPEERAHFRAVTTGFGRNAVVMGRRTFETLGGPLPHRMNIVVTRTMTGAPVTNVRFARSVADAFAWAAELDAHEVFAIGGEEVYLEAVEHVTTIRATEVHARYDGDSVRTFTMPAGWRCVEEGVRRAATTTRPAWTPRVWRRA